ncbi:MAG: FadR/GntR family transcriptional regulator [Candidatus Limnocylindria bacterium]
MKTQWADAATFHLRRRNSLVGEIADHLRRRIVSGDLPFGRRLPSIPHLAQLYGVSVPTMHAAIHAVEALGLLRTRHGVGVFVARPRLAAAVLNHAWMNASPQELALLRSVIDTQAPAIAARKVQQAKTQGRRLPRPLADLGFLAGERSAARIGYADVFLRADLAFHRAVVSCVRGAEMMASVHQTIGQRLIISLLPVAGGQASDPALDRGHRDLATAIVDGRPTSAARLARMIARREMDPLGETLG